MTTLVESVLVQNEHNYDYELKIPADQDTGKPAYIVIVPALGEVLIDLNDWLRVEWADSLIIAQKNQLVVKKIARYPSI